MRYLLLSTVELLMTSLHRHEVQFPENLITSPTSVVKRYAFSSKLSLDRGRMPQRDDTDGIVIQPISTSVFLPGFSQGP